MLCNQTFGAIETVLYDMMSEKVTDAQMLKAIEAEGLSIRDHAVFDMVKWYDERDGLTSCEHSSHNTEEKRAACRDKQRERMAVHTIWYHLGWIQRQEQWENVGGIKYAIFTCNERHGTACKACLEREGLVIPITMRIAPILHPKCNCSLMPIGAQGFQPIRALNGKIRSSRIEAIARNLRRYEVEFFQPLKTAGASSLGCLLPIFVLLIVICSGISLAFRGSL
jgi:hypothetical protein